MAKPKPIGDRIPGTRNLRSIPFCMRCSHPHGRGTECVPRCAECSQCHEPGSAHPRDKELAWKTRCLLGAARRAERERQHPYVPHSPDVVADMERAMLALDAYEQRR